MHEMRQSFLPEMSMNNEWYWVFLIALAGASFLFGRWRGIRDFEKALGDAKKKKHQGPGAV